MKTATIGDIFEFNGTLVKCIGYTTGEKVVVMESLEESTCPKCGNGLGFNQFHIVENYPNFQGGVVPINTITES